MRSSKKAAELSKGYEPNGPVLTQLAVAMGRERCLPAGKTLSGVKVSMMRHFCKYRSLVVCQVPNLEQDLNSLDGAGGETSPMPGGRRGESPGTTELRFRAPVLPMTWKSTTTRMTDPKQAQAGQGRSGSGEGENHWEEGRWE